ncbi:MAG: tetratricopeptide repeat protein [Bryobacteraceae bacterium]|jgi:tetratricopeptide (TPR) repeat protein
MAKPRPEPTPKSRAVSSRELGTAALLFGAVLFAYWPAIHGGFLWDDNAHVTAPALQSLHGLWRIWFDLGATQQYYPLLHSAFWMEHRLWGDAVFGYHLTNLLLHALAAFLVVMIVQRLELPGAWLAGFLFALHPVCVEAVAWISEQKSTLSTVFYLSAALIYLHFDKTRKTSQYFIAFGLFIAALLSKTVTATLPAALLVVFWWKRGRIDWKRDVLPLLPWLALGAAGGLFTAYVERKYVGAEGADYALTLGERCLLAGRVVWFYLAKLVWPTNLTFIYPHWKIDPAVWWQYLFPIGILAAAAALWLLSKSHRGPLAGFLFFAGTLFPVLGFFNVYPFAYSYVADHFQYLASLGIIIPAAAGLTMAAGRVPERVVWGVLLMTLGILTWRQSGMYRDAVTLYQETLVRNPDCWMAHTNLGTELALIPGRVPEAIAHFEAALRIKPDSARAEYDLGLNLAKMSGRTADAIPYYEAALRFDPNFPEAHNNLGIALADIPGRIPDAIAQFEAALRVKPDYQEARNNLGNALLKIPGRSAEAVSMYEEVLSANPDNAKAHNNLGSALMDIPGRMPSAIAQFKEALRIDPDYGEAHNNLGKALSTTPDRLPEAIAQFETALRINPNDAEAHFNLGNALMNTQARWPEAIAQLEAALRIRPDYAEAHNNLGVVLSQTPGRLLEAIPHFEAALRLDPNSADAHCNLGHALSGIPGRSPDALAQFQAALRIRPDMEAARQMMAQLQARR